MRIKRAVLILSSVVGGSLAAAYAEDAGRLQGFAGIFSPNHALAAGQPKGGSQPLHPSVPFPAKLSGARAEAVYQAIKGQMRGNYARSGDPLALEYQQWRRYNKAPYRSPNHGKRFVNHYANDKAASYGDFEKLTSMPVGAIVIKDSFVVTEKGHVRTGPLFMMEKMGPRFRSRAGSWRFMMLRPDGSVLGMTGGDRAGNVKFCAECHKDAGAPREYMYFMPEEVRVRN